VYLWNVGSGLAHMRGVIWRAAPAKFKRGMCKMKILGSEVLWCVFGTMVQDGLAHMRGVKWGAAPAKFKRGMCEMKILGSQVLWCIFATLVQGWHTCEVSSVPGKVKTGMCEMQIFGSEVCSVSWDVGSGWVGSHAWCNMESCSGKVQNRCVK